MSNTARKTRKIILHSLIAAGSLSLAACDGGKVDSAGTNAPTSGSLSNPPDTSSDLRSNDGVLISQLSAGAKVCFDINNNSRCDTLEPSTLATEDGSFTLSPGKSPATLIAELVDDSGSVVRLFAGANSPTVSALTTVLHWSAKARPNLPLKRVEDDLKQLLGVTDLDSSAPVKEASEEPAPVATKPVITARVNAPDIASADTTPVDTAATDTAPTEATITEDAAAEELPSHASIVRQSIELLIAKNAAAAQTDALAAGLDPGMNANQTLLSRLVADQSLTQLALLAEAINTTENADPKTIVDSLPEAKWPADDITLAMQMFAGDSPMEADPIALLEDGLSDLIKQCKTPTSCEVQQRTQLLDDDMKLSLEKHTVFADGRREGSSRYLHEVSNLVLSADGEWKTLDTSGMATVTRSSEYSAEMTDGNNDTYELRATARSIADTPVAPLLDKMGFEAGDLPMALRSFGKKAKLISLQREQKNDRYELLFQPSEGTLGGAAAEQALGQAEITLSRLQEDVKRTENALREVQFSSDISAENAELTQAEVDALTTAKSAVADALTEAQAALEVASGANDSAEETVALIEAYTSVLADAVDKVAALTVLDTDAKTALTAAESVQQTASSALEQATSAYDAVNVIATTAADAPATTDTTTDSVVAEATVIDPAVLAGAEDDKLKAERDLIVAGAALVEAQEAADNTASALETAKAEKDDAELALNEANSTPANTTGSEVALQEAQLLVSANETNLALIEQEIEQAIEDATAAEELADTDAALLSESQASLDKLLSKQTKATDDLAASQAAVASNTETTVGSGCEETLPAQSAENYNCTAIERRIGTAPATAVPTLSELTATSSSLTLLKLHPDHAVTMLSADGANQGSAAWHGTDDTYDATDTSLPLSQWTKQEVNGVQLITITVPDELQEAGQATELLMAEQDNYVRPGVVVHAGEIVTESLLNEEALEAILP